jgi:hypothetical protein
VSQLSKEENKQAKQYFPAYKKIVGRPFTPFQAFVSQLS